MKKLLILLLFIPLVSFGQDFTSSRLGNKWIYDNVLYYEVIFDEDLNLDDGYINIKMLKTIAVTSYLKGAKIKVQKKNGRTRVLVYDFDMGSDNFGGGTLLGGMAVGGSTEQTYVFSDQVYNSNKKKWKRFVRGINSERVEKAILKAIRNNAGVTDKILDDW